MKFVPRYSVFLKIPTMRRELHFRVPTYAYTSAKKYRVIISSYEYTSIRVEYVYSSMESNNVLCQSQVRLKIVKISETRVLTN